MRSRGRTGPAHSRCHWVSLPKCSLGSPPAVMGTPSTLGSGPALRKDTHLLTFFLHQLKKLAPAEDLRGNFSGVCLLSPEALHLDRRGLSRARGTYMPGTVQGALTHIS